MKSKSIYTFRFMIGIMAVLMCPGIAASSVVAAHGMLADAALIPYGAEVEFLAGKNIAYWFLTLAGVSIASWTWIVKWLIKQLEAQRDSNAQLVQTLLTAKEKENQELRELLTRTVTALEHSRYDKESIK